MTPAPDPQTRDMLAAFRAMPPAARRAFVHLLIARAARRPVYPAALRFLRIMKHPDAAGRAAELAAEMGDRDGGATP